MTRPFPRVWSLLSFLSVSLPLSLSALTGCGAGAAAPPTSAAGALPSTSVEVPSAANAARVAAILTRDEGGSRRGEDRRAARPGPRQAKDVAFVSRRVPGMDVADVLAPGSGYFTELVARSVGIDGRLFARNPPSLVASGAVAHAWDERLTRPAGARVVRIDDELGKPLAVHGLDLVFLDHDYASLSARGVEPSALDAAVWNALREDGRFVVVEARKGEDAATQRTIESHGFHLAKRGALPTPGSEPRPSWSEGGTAGARSGSSSPSRSRSSFLEISPYRSAIDSCRSAIDSC